MSATHEQWKEQVEDAYAESLEVGRQVTPTPIVVGRPTDPLDEASELEDGEHVPEGLQGWAWVELEATSPEAEEFRDWLSGAVDTEHRPSVKVRQYENSDEAQVVRIDIDGASGSIEPAKAAADSLAASLNELVPGLVARSVERFN